MFMIDTFHFTFTFTFNLLIFFLLALLMFMEYMYSVYGRDPKYLSYLYVIENNTNNLNIYGEGKYTVYNIGSVQCMTWGKIKRFKDEKKVFI